MEDSNRNTFATAVTFLFIGLGLGAISALLLAPKTGRQLRRDIRRRYDDARDAMEDFGEQAGEWIDRGSEWVDAAKERVAPLGKKIRTSMK